MSEDRDTQTSTLHSQVIAAANEQWFACVVFSPQTELEQTWLALDRELVIGRSADASTLPIDDHRMSRRHASLRPEANGIRVIDEGSRMNFPSRHPLNQTQRARAAAAEADLIVGLESADFWGTVNAVRDQLHRSTRRLAKPDARLITISTGDLYIRANYQDFRRLQEVDLAIAAAIRATRSPHRRVPTDWAARQGRAPWRRSD